MERQWRNPNDVMKTRSIRKKKLQRASSLGGVNKENSPLKSLNRSVNESGTVRKRTAGIALGEQENCPNALTPTKSNLCSPSTKKFRSSGLSEVSFNVHRNISKKEKLSAGQVDFPLDLSLKSKARFMSLHPFTWTASVKTHQEANGISKFVRSQSSAEESVDDVCSEFQRNLMVWVHPSLPFMKLFPRMETKVSSVGQQFTWLPDQQLLNSLKEDWDTSFRSLFQLLTMGHCPYFYLCANHFTVLFVYAGVMGCAHITALLSPTTGGFRQALKKGGVEFTLPLASGAQPKAEGTINGILEDSENEDESAASTWLCSLGIATQDFPTANTPKITFQRSSPVNIDNHPESVVRVEASNVHALFNFLLTSKTTITTTGAHAGIPPTLVAPVAYEGSTLKSLTARQGTVHEHVGGKLMQFHSLDISGPILPEALYNLSCLFQQTQHSNFMVYTTSVMSTGSFNAASTKPSTLPPPVSSPTSKFNHYLTLKPISQKSGLKEVSCKNDCYTWN